MPKYAFFEGPYLFCCAQETGNVEDESEAAEDGQGADDNARDPETFDDSEFYQQLLKELLEGSGADAAAMQASTQVCGSLLCHNVSIGFSIGMCRVAGTCFQSQPLSRYYRTG